MINEASIEIVCTIRYAYAAAVIVILIGAGVALGMGTSTFSLQVAIGIGAVWGAICMLYVLASDHVTFFHDVGD